MGMVLPSTDIVLVTNFIRYVRVTVMISVVRCMYIGDDTTAHHGGQRAAASRTPAHDVSHPPVTLNLTKRPHIEQESASEADGASERDYES